MSDSYLQVTGQDGPSESGLYKSSSSEELPGVTMASMATSAVLGNDMIHPGHETFIAEEGGSVLYYKTSEDSLDLMSNQDSPIGGKQSMLGYQDTDSCLSVSPSPDPDCKTKTFDFSMIDPTAERTNISAAIQMEQEFLDFMFSLPQIQKEAIAKEQLPSVLPALPMPKEEEVQRPKLDKKSPTRSSQPIGNTSRVGLDHLDNLCRMMEQLGDLKEQNTRLQRRVIYLEELKTLHEMHRDMQDSIAARKTALSLGSVSLSDSDLRLEDLNKSCGYLLDSEESLDQSVSVAKSSKDQMLEPPHSSLHLQRHSSSEDDRRVKEDPRRPSDKEKKGHKSAWGKVKHMISYNSKRENVRKKSTAGVETPRKDYDTEFESLDPDGTSWDWEGEGEGGIWMGPKSGQDPPEGSDPFPLSEGESAYLGGKKGKPQLTITVPSSENLHNVPAGHLRLTPEFKSTPGSSPSKGESKSGPEFSTTPPSPRRSSNWTKVKLAFLTGPAVNHQTSEQEMSLSQGGRPQPQHYPQYRHNHLQQRLSHPTPSSQPPSPSKKTKPIKSNFSFDGTSIAVCGPGPDESDSQSGVSPEISPDEILLPSQHRSSKGHSRGSVAARHGSLPSSVVHKNLIDLQRTLTGEFNKKLQEWERLKNHQSVYGGVTEGGRSGEVSKGATQHTGESLPQEFRKKLHEWEKMKGKDKEKLSRSSEAPRIPGHAQLTHHLLHLHHHHHHHQVLGQDDLKTKKHDEDDLPADFKKKLTEWEIRKALVGKGQQNVEQLQKNLGEEFNKKLAEWERMKALGQGKIPAQGMHESSLAGGEDSAYRARLQHGEDTSTALGALHMAQRGHAEDGTPMSLREQVPLGVRFPHSGVFIPQGALDRKGSSHKVKKTKSGKLEKTPLAKPEGQKNRDKELLWLEKELNKIEREKQRLEREKEKFLEREARLEKIRHAMRQGPAEKKEIYIKTSTGEFRFEGISQTFTKKLYEWEERRGIRPESSTFVLLDPNYKAPEKEEQRDASHQSPETKRITRARSESSVVEMGQGGGISALLSHQSSISLNEMDKDETAAIQAENKSASEPTLCAEDICDTSKCAMLVQMEELVEEVEVDGRQMEEDVHQEDGITLQCEGGGGRKRHSSVYEDPYAPAEITRLIDSSGSEDNLTRRQKEVDEDLAVVATNGIVLTTPKTFSAEGETLCLVENDRSEESYRTLLHENMNLLGRLKEQESLCRALETQMGDIDSKMDNVADQHLKTLEKLHRQVSIMTKSESSSRMSNDDLDCESTDDGEAESNERLISQLKARIVELELKGDKLMAEKEELECAFKLHKDHETRIAESLLIRIRELQDAGAEVNIQTVQSQTDDSLVPEESQETSDDPKVEKGHPESTSATASPSTSSLPPTPGLQPAPAPFPSKKKRRKRRDEYTKNAEDEAYEEDKDESDDDQRRGEKEAKEPQKRKRKMPPKKVQKLHNLTADLLFQAKRLEGALVAKHHLSDGEKENSDVAPPRLPRKRSLKGRSSLRLSKDEGHGRSQRKPPKDPGTARTWSSIEAIGSPEQDRKKENSNWETRAAALASESKDLLAMNAELSRMARELRKEMMNVWSFRESTSPESNSSDNREETIKSKLNLCDLTSFEVQEKQNKSANPSKEDQWLEEEAREVFDGIASLQPLVAEISKSHEISDSDEKFNVPPTESIPKRETADSCRELDESLEDTSSYETRQPVIVKSEEHFHSWWEVPIPKKRKSSLKSACNETSENIANEHTYIEDPGTPESADFESIIPGSSGIRLGDLLMTNDSQNEKNEASCSFRLSPYYETTSQKLSRTSSSASEDERKEGENNYLFIHENEDDGSVSGTIKTTTSSTFKSDILSSSFEYDNKDKNSYGENKYQNIPYMANRNSWYDATQLTYPPSKKSEFTPTQLSKVGKMVQEAVLTMEKDCTSKPFKEVCNKEEELVDANYLEKRKFETEVKEGSKLSKEDGGLRTRRVSDTQVVYEDKIEDFHFYSRDENDFHSERSPRLVTRIPSIRRNQSESDVSWLQVQHNSLQNAKQAGTEVFVTTHRTIFTLSGDKNANLTQAIPTFLHENDGTEQSTESLDNNDQDLSDSTLKDELSSSSGNGSGSPNLHERNICSKSSITTDKRKKVEKQIKTTNGSTKLKLTHAETKNKSLSLPPLTSPPVSPTFLDALSSSFHQNSPPVESKKKVLEAANESSPTVKNMIDLYNKRITEKQELLINPFKPGDPYSNKKTSNSSTDSLRNLCCQLDGDAIKHNSYYNIAGPIFKSSSASVLQNRGPMNIQRSFSGTNGIRAQYEISEPESAPVGILSNPINLQVYPTNLSHLGNDSSFDFDISTEESLDTLSESRLSSPQPPPEKGPAAKLRAIKIKKAKEEFLARGAGPVQTKIHQNEELDLQFNAANTEILLNREREGSVPVSSQKSSFVDIRAVSEAPSKPPRTLELREVSIPRKESFRRQSESCLPDEISLRSNVYKSASSGLIELRKRNDQGLPPSNKENRKSSLESTENKRSSKGIFKLFKRSRAKERKDLGTVQKLCRQSLAVDVCTSKKAMEAGANEPKPSTSTSPSSPACSAALDDGSRSSKTLPREAQSENSASSSRSCPSSPVALRKSKTAQWLAKGKNIFKSRSPSPNKRPR